MVEKVKVRERVKTEEVGVQMCLFFYVYCFDKGVSEMINLALRQELKSNQGINKLEVYLTHCLTGQLSLEKEETDVYASTKRKEMYKKCEIALSHTHTRMPIHPHTHAHVHIPPHTYTSWLGSRSKPINE